MTHAEVDVPVPDTAGLQRLISGLLTSYLREFGTAANRYGLTAAQAKALTLLDEPLPMRTLADKLYCDASNVTGIVDRLEARGLVQRQVHKADRRVKNVVASEAGVDIAQRILSELHNTHRALAALSPQERHILHDLLGRILPILDGTP